jgi:hypothetical protein
VTVSESFGATEVAITGCNDMHTKIATIINAERFMFTPFKSTMYYYWRKKLLKLAKTSLKH